VCRSQFLEMFCIQEGCCNTVVIRRLNLGHVLNPVLALKKEEGSVLMLGVAGLLSVSNR
jgi:hypothetical protein